jgi:hypothetical protein
MDLERNHRQVLAPNRRTSFHARSAREPLANERSAAAATLSLRLARRQPRESEIVSISANRRYQREFVRKIRFEIAV